MDHAAAEDLDPAGSLTESAAFSAALEAGDIDLSGRLREREMMRTELCLRLRSEQLLCEYIERSFEIGKCYVLVDDQSLDLMEGRGMCRVDLVRAEHTSRRDHTDRELSLLHDTGLYRRCLCAEKNIFCDIEGVLLILRRMVRRNVELCEVIVIVLDLRSLDHFIAHADENTLDLLEGDGIRMAVADEFHFRGKRDVDLFLLKLARHFLGIQPVLHLGHARFDLSTGVVDPLADLRTILRIDILHGFQDCSQRAFLSEK